MQIIKEKIKTEDGLRIEMYGAAINFPDGEYRCGDISNRAKNIALFAYLLRYFHIQTKRDADNFTVDFISLTDKYAR